MNYYEKVLQNHTNDIKIPISFLKRYKATNSFPGYIMQGDRKLTYSQQIFNAFNDFYINI